MPANILYLHTTSEIGGSDVSLVRLVEQLDRRRFTPIVVLPSDGPLVPRLQAADARVLVMPSLWKLTSRKGRVFLAAFAVHYPFAVRALTRLIRQQHIALVHTNTIHNLYGGAAARRRRVPHVWHIREIVWQSAALRRLEVALVRRWSSRIIVTSDAVAAMFGPADRRPPQLVKISNGIDVDRFTPGDGERVRRELGVLPGQPFAAIVCRLDDWKGVDVFLDAAAEVAATHPAAQFAVFGGAIVGQEEYAEALKRRPSAIRLGPRLRFTDWRYPPNDMPDVCRAIDVLVVASTQPEPFGLTAIEAMSAEKPVIATNHGGPAEIVEDGVTGWLVPPRDPAAMADAMRRVFDDRDRARRMGAAGRARAVSLFSVRSYVDAIQRVYAELLNRTAAA